MSLGKKLLFLNWDSFKIQANQWIFPIILSRYHLNTQKLIPGDHHYRLPADVSVNKKYILIISWKELLHTFGG